ncbi:MAG: bifunctional adenosylcobinamide kinase/adenosylcobinamide-phosphate guanylyltransferase [Solibacillus sp.]
MIFITGGVRSGKSAFAEQLAARFAGGNYYYVATGQAFDAEMLARIRRHQQDRAGSEVQWRTIEMSTHLPNVQLREGDVLLFECVTTWLGNVQYESAQQNVTVASFIQQFKTCCKAWQQSGATVIVVSNELLDEPASHFVEVNEYRQMLGALHQWLVAQSVEAYEVDHQIVKQWK